MKDTARRLRREISRRVPARGPGRRYPADLQERIAAFFDDAVDSGEAALEVAGALGIPLQTIERWRECLAVECGVPLLATVEVVADVGEVPAAACTQVSGLTVYGPAGLRIEGADVATVAALWRALQ